MQLNNTIMKSTKILLPLLAFVFALVTAFTSERLLKVDARGHRPSDGACVEGILLPPPGYTMEDCRTSNNAVRCDIRIVDQGESVLVSAFDHSSGTCDVSQELFYSLE
jgi:hypothetical protein